ncbi:alpha/beta fold hydrolase [Rhizobiales bacterium]|uniref:alpha/beta fold hydrolase n=1 Tax=Hongsoonwoonella zoysiae TaxID=2821844 RepID=UPI001560AC33|nr:alpha/beta fold hydrolase [Hongsoonwoonella zoysiae]NRG17454.1 alpha/beta fold hydrolase [Hongsoonwoonella zoysiae]
MRVPAFETRGDAPETLILLHGIGAGAEMFSPQLDGLSDRFTVIAWNMPGYGGTPLDGEMTFEGLSDALLALIDHLGIEKANLLGHSIGGMIAQEFYARHPERVRSLILSGTTSAFGSRDGEFQKKFVSDRLAPLDAGKTIPELAASFVPHLVGSASLPSAIDIARVAMSRLSPETYREVIRCLATFDRREELSRISVPTLLIAGEEDTNAPLKSMKRIAEQIEGARFEALAGIGHLAPLEAPDAYNGLIKSFYAITFGGLSP